MHSWLNGAVRRSSSSLGGILERLSVYVPAEVGEPGSLCIAYAKPAGEGLLRLLGPVPKGEEWRYLPGECVEYDDQVLPDGTHGLVVTGSASRDPEFRVRRIIYGLFGSPVGSLVAVIWMLRMGVRVPYVYVLGALAGSITFALASMRWGDRAWYGVLRRTFRTWATKY